MIISSKEANERLHSSMNLFNNLRNNTNNSSRKSMNIFGISKQDSRQDNTKSIELVKSNPFNGIVESVKPAALMRSFLTPTIKEIVVTETASITSPELQDIVESSDQRIRLELAHDEALSTLVASVQSLKAKLCEVDNPAKLADIAAKMGKVVDQIRTSKINAAKSREDRQMIYHFYIPETKPLEQFEVIDV